MREKRNTCCWTPGICVRLMQGFCVLSLCSCCFLWWSQPLIWHGFDPSSLLSSDSYLKVSILGDMVPRGTHL